MTLKTFSGEELYQAVDEYLRDRETLIAQAKSQVAEWKSANSEMFGLHPLHNEFAMRGEDMWRPADRQWLTESPGGEAFKHGLDANGQVLIIESPIFIKLFKTDGDIVDEVRYTAVNNRNLILARTILHQGRAAACYECFTSPQQYTCETFQYEQDRCVSSETKTRYVADKKWKEASWIINCTYQYDARGLLRVYRDAGVLSDGRHCVFARSGEGVIAKQHRGRRPFATFSIAIAEDEEDKNQTVYSNAYGIEMSINDEWPVDIVLLTPPKLLRNVFNDTGVTSMRNVTVGGNPIKDRCDLRRVRKSRGKWVKLVASDPATKQLVVAALRVSLRVILEVNNAAELSMVLTRSERLNDQSLVVAMRLGSNATPESAQSTAAAMRAELAKLGCAECRLVVAAELKGADVAGYVAQPDIDGVFHHDDTFDKYLSMLKAVVIECS